MATVRWEGGAAAVAQVTDYVFGGTWEVGDRVVITIGNKSWTYSVTDTSITTFLPLLATAYNALSATDYPEFAELTASSDSSTFTLTADTAGKPFAATLATTESDGGAADAQTIDSLASSTGTTSTASAGPNDWSTAANWSGGAVPVNSDDVYLEDSDDDILYGLAQSGVTLASLNIAASFTGTLGLPDTNADGTDYPEYRAKELAISATALNVGAGPGAGSGRLRINVGSAACTLTVRGTASALDDDAAALRWRGTHSSNVVRAYAGTLDVATEAAHTAVVATLDVGGSASVRCGPGTTLTTVNQSGGALEINSAATTVTRDGGTLEVYGAGAITTLTSHAGTVVYASGGTVTTYTGGPESSIDFGRDLRDKTVTNCTLHPGAELSDPAGVVTFTNGITLSRCRLDDVSLDVGYNRTVTPS